METKFKPLDENLKTLAGSEHLPEIVVYEHINYDGWNFRTNLNVLYIGDAMNDRISSFIIVSGRWQFYRHRDFIEPLGPVFGPGYYHWVEEVGIPNDQISSFKCVGI
jgi:hypothetical protein